MNNQDDLQEAKQEAEFLQKRAWDFIAKLEKLESELEKTTDADKRAALQTRIKNTRRLLNDYQVEYKSFCEEAGLTPENFTPAAPPRDLVSSLSRKTLKTRENLERGQEIDLPPFFQVPSRNPKFTGRKDEVRDFIQRVLQGGAFAICGVKGMGGIGKSEIAKEVCHLFRETWQDTPDLPDYVADLLTPAEGGWFRDGMLWIQFEPEAQTPKSLTEWLIPRLLSGKAAEQIKDLDALAELLADKDVLVVLDSVEQNLRTFDYVLERFKGKFPLIITSRVAIPGIHAIDIDMLSDDEAEALFIAHLENPAVSDRETVRALCKLLGNYPLILKIIASRVEADHSNLAQLQALYQDNRKLLLEESGAGIEPRNAMVKSCFALSFDSLDEPEQRAFLHGGLFNNPFSAAALAALLEDSTFPEPVEGNSAERERDIHHIVNRLARFSLFNRLKGQDGQEALYELHPLMREFALDRLQTATEPGRKEAIAALLKTLQEAEKAKQLPALLQDRAVVLQAAEAMQYCDQVFDFAAVREWMNLLNGPLYDLGYWDDKIRLNRLAIRAAVALQNRSDEAVWRASLADVLERKARSKAELEQAHKEWKHALWVVRELICTDNLLRKENRLDSTEETITHLTENFSSISKNVVDLKKYIMAFPSTNSEYNEIKKIQR